MARTTIVLADDHHVVRQGLRVLLETEPGFSVVGEAADGQETVKLVERLKPDVLIVDVVMPGLNGLEVTRQVRRRSPQTRVLILSMYANESYVLDALKNGATGYVLKDCNAADLVRGVHEVAAGRRYLGPPLTERAIEAYIQKALTKAPDKYETLTTREREVLQLAAEGYNNPEIAVRMFISPRTVEVHRANVMRKLGLHNQSELVRYALRRGIISLET
jgi:DNA-binding NarL/FixJ family response regulator